MPFDLAPYTPDVAAILALDGSGERLMPLAGGRCSSEEARERLSRAAPARLFPGARSADAARAGLYLYFSCWDEAHRVAQDIPSAEGSYWHAIVHRQEPDAGNSGYWLRRTGTHAIFPALRSAADRIAAASGRSLLPGKQWDPFAFLELCEQARGRSGSDLEQAAREIQRAEWQLLFQHCAAPR